jgi:hypothetical protein
MGVLQKGRFYPKLLVVCGVLYACGGDNASTFSMEYYDEETQEWILESGVMHGQDGIGILSVAHGESIYVFGLMEEATLNNVNRSEESSEDGRTGTLSSAIGWISDHLTNISEIGSGNQQPEKSLCWDAYNVKSKCWMSRLLPPHCRLMPKMPSATDTSTDTDAPPEAERIFRLPLQQLQPQQPLHNNIFTYGSALLMPSIDFHDCFDKQICAV